MLLIIETIKTDCPKGANLAEQVQVSRRKIQTVVGDRWEPVFECTYVSGTPFGSLPDVVAPCALKAGDVISVEAAEGEVVEVKRGNSVIYTTLAKSAGAGPRGGKHVSVASDDGTD